MIPSDPSTLAKRKVHASAVAEDIHLRGLHPDDNCDLRIPARNCVGCNHEEWREYNQPSGIAAKWNLNSLWVMAYLSSLTNVVEDDVGCESIPQPRDLIDFQDVLLSMAMHWRENDFSSEFFERLRSFEFKLAQVIQVTCAEHDHPDSPVVLDICCVLSYMWAEEYLFREVLPVQLTEAPVFEHETDFQEWVHLQRDQMKMTHMTMNRPLLGAVLAPGELERYARGNGGVFAADFATALEETRPYVAHKALLETCEDLDPGIGCGTLVMRLVNRYLISTIKFPWVVHNVFLDVEFMSCDKHKEVKHRTQPWILLVGSRWYIVSQDRSWWTTSPYRAVLMWFHLLYQKDPIFFMLLEEWDLSGCIFKHWCD